MNIIHITPSIAEKLSGPTYSVISLCKNIQKYAQVNLFTLSNNIYEPISENILDDANFIKYFNIGFGPKKLGRSPSMMSELYDWSKKKDNLIVHNHGTWHMTAIYPSKLKGKNIKIINSPRGTMSPDAFTSGSKFKYLFWSLFLRKSFNKADCFHATSLNECDDIRKMGFSQPIAVIQNGVDIPEILNDQKNKKILLYIGRLHKSKGIEDLLKAWKNVMNNFEEWELHIVGSDKLYNANSSYKRKLEHLTNSLQLKRVKFINPLFDELKRKKYQESSITILPSYFESFGMTVAESLANATPVITTTKTPWKNLELKKAGWCVNTGEVSLTNILNIALNSNMHELKKMGDSGRKWMQEDYSWKTISEMTYNTYLWMQEAIDKPKWVMTNE